METILVVDDEAELLAMVREMLEGAGYRILEAADAEAALRIAASHAEPIDLLLTDVMMPGMSGSALAQQVSRDRPETKILYMSGFTLVPAHQAVSEGDQGLEAGSPIIAKPFTIESLTAKVREVLDSKPPLASTAHGPRPARWGTRRGSGEPPPRP
jgi:two-component system cell cycle sensor histidine kinase/response regulator CckA